jgi:hypothetical protein
MYEHVSKATLTDSQDMVLKMHMAKTPRATIRFEYFFYE